ncbi:MAG: hypothetical protein ITG01_07410 [Comamonas sp.]|nr:hypothetical protein [Comamonas sp.]
MKQRWWAMGCGVLGAVALAGCASASKGGTDAVVQVDVNHARRVTTIAFSPQLMDCGRVAHCPTLGAQWSSETPNRTVIEENMYSGERSSPAADALKRLVYEAYKGTDKEMSMGLSGIFGDKPYAPNLGK